MKRFITTMSIAVCLMAIAVSCSADSISQTVSGGSRWMKTSADGKWDPVTNPLAGVSYNIVSADDGTAGYTFGWKISGAEDELINRYSFGKWWVKGGLEPFADALLETWGDGFTGENEFLGGGEAGVRFDVGAATFQFSGSVAGGADKIGDATMYFGIYVAQEMGEDEDE